MESTDCRLLDDGGTLFIRAAKRFRIELDAQLRLQGVSACQYHLMNSIREHGGMTQGSLAQLTGIDRTALVSVIDELEAKEWVTRNEVPGDRRANRVELTDLGTRVLEKSMLTFQSFQQTFLGRLNSDEINTLNELLRRLV